MAAVVLLMHFLAALTAYYALQTVRTSQAAVAWVVGLVTLPYVTLPLYWVFARRRFEGYREAVREVGDQHQHSVAAIRRELFTDPLQRTTQLSTPLEQVADVLDTPISYDNEFRLLIDGREFFDAVFDQIASAERYIYVSFYILRDDQIGNRFADALTDRARSGVQVRLLYDEVGCLSLSNRYLRRLEDAGVDVRAFNTRQGWANRFQINFRNHRKLVVVDGDRALVGGLNIGDEYLGQMDWAPRWRDTSVEMSGRITRKIQAVFAGDYYWAARKDLPEAIWRDGFGDHDIGSADPSSAPSLVNTGDAIQPNRASQNGLAVVCATGPADKRPNAVMMFAAAIGAAKQRLWISTPYLVPDDAIMIALAMAKSRGVDVRLLIPSVPDQWAVFLAGFYYERELADIDIPVYRYSDGMLHQKCVLVDRSMALIGSTNLDNRSLYLNFELMVAVQDPDFVFEVESMLERDFEKSQRSNGSGAPARPWIARIGTAVARLFSPVL